MTTHDFRPGDVVEWHDSDADGDVVCKRARIEYVHDGYAYTPGHPRIPVSWLTLIARENPNVEPASEATPTEHPSRSRAASSLRAASASLTTAIDHLTRAGEAETCPGQTVIRIRTASEETQACIQHATMALYWMLHERLGS